MAGILIFIKALIWVLAIKGTVGTVTTHNQSGCYNSDVMLACPHYTPNKPGTIIWRFRDTTAGRWAKVATIRNGQTKLTSTYTALDGRSVIHPNGSLEIHSLGPDDETMYQCIVRQGSRKLHVVNLDVSCGKVSIIKREVCIEEHVVLNCDSWHRTNPRKLHQVKWHKKNTSGTDVSWSLLVSSSGSNGTVGDGFKLHGNGSLLLPGGRDESDVVYRCDVSKNVAIPLDRHIIMMKNVHCHNQKQLKGTVRTTAGRVAMTTANPNRGINVAMATNIPDSNQVCGGVLNTSAGAFQSPNFPSAYPANSHCKWTISLPQDYAAINITLNRVNLEDEIDCLNDYISIYDALNNQVGCRICGTQTSSVKVQVRGRGAVIVFRSIGSVQTTGFQASYKGTMNAG